MTWGRDSFLLLNVKWNTLSLENNCLLLFFFLPCTHLTWTTRTCRGEVFQTFQAGESWGRGGVKGHQMNRRGPGASRLVDDRVSFLLHFWQTKSDPIWMSSVWAVTHTSRPQIKKKKRLLVRLIITTVAKRQTLLFSNKLVLFFVFFVFWKHFTDL